MAPTCLEKIDTGFVTSDVKIILQQSLCLEPQLGEVVAPVVSK